MSANFFKIHKGITLEPQTGADPFPARDGDVYYNDTLGKFRKHENGSWTDLGGSTTANSRSGNESVGLGQTQITVIFSSPLPTANYVVLAEMTNTTDSDTQFQSLTVTNKTVNGFTVKWNDATDSANYEISYSVPGSMATLAEVSIPLGATSITATLPVAFSSALYVAIGSMQNNSDLSPQFQPVIVTNKTPSSVTFKWNSPTDSNNYMIAYHAVAIM